MGIGIPNLLMNLISCHGFLKNKDPIIVLKAPKSIFEYYFSKGFTYFDCTIINLEKLPIEVKQIIHAKYTDNSDKVMVCYTTIPSTSNKLNNLAVNTSFNYSYIQKEFNDRKEEIINICSAYVEPLILVDLASVDLASGLLTF